MDHSGRIGHCSQNLGRGRRGDRGCGCPPYSCLTEQMADSLEYTPFLIIVRLLYRRRWTVSPCRPRWGEISAPLNYSISSPSPNGRQHADAAVSTFPPSRFLRGFRELGRPVWGRCLITFTTLRRDRSASISPACGNHFNGRVCRTPRRNNPSIPGALVEETRTKTSIHSTRPQARQKYLHISFTAFQWVNPSERCGMLLHDACYGVFEC